MIPPSTVFNNIAKSEDNDLLVPNVDRDGLITGGPDNESIIFHSTLGTDYNSFLNEFDVDANNMDNIVKLNARDTDIRNTRSMTQLRSNTINGIQSTTEMTDYIRMYMFNYIAGYTSSASVGAGAGLKSSEYKGGKAIKPNKSMIEEIEEEKDNALMSIENKKKTDIATLKTRNPRRRFRIKTRNTRRRFRIKTRNTRRRFRIKTRNTRRRFRIKTRNTRRRSSSRSISIKRRSSNTSNSIKRRRQ